MPPHCTLDSTSRMNNRNDCGRTLRAHSALGLTVSGLGWAHVAWLSLVLASTGLCASPQGKAKVDLSKKPAALEQIKKEGLLEHATVLAGDAYAGRLTGTDAQHRAAEYIAEAFESFGLEPLGDGRGKKRSWLQSYPIQTLGLVDKKTKIKVGKTELEDGFGLFMPSSDESLKVQVRGRWRLIDPSEPPPRLARIVPVVLLRNVDLGPVVGGGATRQYSAALRLLQRIRGAASKIASNGGKVAVFLLGRNDEGLMSNLNTRGIAPGKPRITRGKARARRGRQLSIPTLFFTRAQAERVVKEFGLDSQVFDVDDRGLRQAMKQAKLPKGTLQLDVRYDAKAEATNVVGVLRGSHPKYEKDAIVYSAHMDHVGQRFDGEIFNGADDNASGTAGLLEIARAYGQSETPPKRSVIFLSVSGEELGLWGSAHFADHPTWPVKRILANINTDMIGRSGEESSAQQVTVTPSSEHKAYSTLVRNAEILGKELGLEFQNGDKYYQRSDHYNFARKGIPVVFFCNGEHEDYHKVTDTADKLDGDKMQKIARLAFWTGWLIASGEHGRPRDM